MKKFVFILPLLGIIFPQILITTCFEVEKFHQSIMNSNDKIKHCTAFISINNILFSDSLHSNFYKREPLNHQFLDSNQNEKLIFSSSSPDLQLHLQHKENKTLFFLRPKFKDNCILALIEMQVFTNPYFDKWTEILRIDTDFFVFMFYNLDNYSLINLSTPFKNVKNQIVIIFHKNYTASAFNSCPYCNPEQFLPVQLEQKINLFPDFLQNFHGKQLTVSCPIYTKSVFEVDETYPDNLKVVRGVMQSAFLHLVDKYNFTAKYILSTGGGTGRKFPNGTWIGTVGDLLSDKADIGQVTAQVYGRDTMVSFSNTIMYIWLTFTTGISQPYYTWRSVYRPYSKETWILTIISSLVAIATLYTISKISIGKAAQYLLQMLLEQDVKLKGDRHSFRILICFWLIFCLLITTAYRSQLVTFLLFPTLYPLPTTFDQLAQSLELSQFKVGLNYIHGAAYAVLKSSQNPTFKTIFENLELDESEVNCLNRTIYQPQFACITWQAVADYAFYRNLSDQHGYAPLKMIQEINVMVSLGLVYRKGAVFKEKFDDVISQAFDMGLNEKWIQLDNSLLRRGRSVRENVPTYHKDNGMFLKLEHLSGTFYILLVGLGVALVIFPLELFISSLKNFTRSRWYLWLVKRYFFVIEFK